jgi:hypothetical protein
MSLKIHLLILVQLGRLNLLTPRRVAAAAAEIRTGEIINLKYFSCPYFHI